MARLRDLIYGWLTTLEVRDGEEVSKKRRALGLRWSVVTLDPGKRQMNIFLLVDTTIEGAILPTRARNNDNWDRRRIVNNMR